MTRSVILGFMEEIQDQHNIIINHILLIYKHLSRNCRCLNFIGISETKIFEEKMAQNDRPRKHNFLKK